ncbi:MAG: carboxypeptidase-like regulatory domain-containing protein, partial [Bacteroidales bacterium]|nr:carboxypeptidase-like regulatory domain-containing protein [Bacteroidales bacterium]
MLSTTKFVGEVRGKHVIIKQGTNTGASRIVTGTILDENGEPVAGATVLAKGTNIGTVTDINGNYSLEVPAGCKVLQYSYIGYTSQDIAIEGKRAVNVTMQEDSQLLEDVVVVGYGVQRKVDLTGSVSAITARELENKPVMSTAQALAGVAPGLSVVANSGRPGAGASIKIRGTGTFSSAGNDPLILIDGLAGSIDDV